MALLKPSAKPKPPATTTDADDDEPFGTAKKKKKKKKKPLLIYEAHLWHEKELKSTANVTRRDAEEFLPLAAEIPIVPSVQTFPLEDANEALVLQKQGRIDGAAVLTTKTR